MVGSATGIAIGSGRAALGMETPVPDIAQLGHHKVSQMYVFAVLTQDF